MSSDNQDDGAEAVRLRAYFLWLNEGQPTGRAEDHWRLAWKAENPVIAGDGTPRWGETSAPAAE